MVRQRQADLLQVAATVIAACGWIFSREAIAGMPVFAFPGLRFFICGAAAAAVLSRLSRRIVIATSLRFGLQMKGQKYAAVASAALWYGEQLP